MLRAVLFDLDETLLDLDLVEFLKGYFADLTELIADVSGLPYSRSEEAIMHASHVMLRPRTDDMTNEGIFSRMMAEEIGIDLATPEVTERFRRYHERGLDHLRADYGPHEGAHEAVEAVKRLGLKPVLATNPTFPLPIGIERVRWAGFSPSDFEFITSYETSTRTKPYARYYEETLARAGVSVDEAIMVGNDHRNDLADPDIGLRVFLVEESDDERVTWNGSLLELPSLLEELVVAHQ